MSGEDRPRKVLPSTCTQHGDARGFTNLVVRRLDDGIELDPHAVGGCVVTLDEAAANQLFDLLGEWLG
ncbi:MAG: hypothetical protein ACRDTD_21975 [Pseudonocardiaceae bacterium]